MSNFDFPCRFEKLKDGTEIVRCRDLPELLSYSVDGEPLENWARYAVEDCVENLFRRRHLRFPVNMLFI